MIPSLDHEFALLDTVKIANTVLFIVSAEEGVDIKSDNSWASQLLTTTFSQVCIIRIS